MRNALYIVVFFQSFLFSVLLVPLVIKIADRFNIVDKPGARKIHQTAHPLLGGVAIFSSFLMVVLLNVFLLYQFGNWEFLAGIQRITVLVPQVLSKLLLLLGGGFAIHVLGLLDDIFKEKIPYSLKFVVQVLIAAVVAIGGIRTQFMPTEILDILITIIWIVGITNSFNLLDNLDGLTAGVSVIASIIFIIIAILQGQIFFALILCALAGPCLGFLFYNYFPSKLFMGDSGSLFIGYMFGALTVMGSYVVKSSASLLPVIIPILVLSVPLYDTFSVMYIRWREGRPLFLGDKRHFSHRLLDLGMTHRQSVNFIYLVAFGVGITALLLPYLSIIGGIVVVLQAFVIYSLLTILITIGRRLNLKNKNKK